LAIVADVLAIAREALSNIARHSGAEHAAVRLSDGDDVMEMEITDDGRGLSSEAEIDGSHHGLANMRARAEALGGTFEIESAPRSGTRIIVTVPRAPDRRGGRP
jgi:signal transduction histidine kinase